MAATYSGNPSGSDVDRLRFYTGDTNVYEPLLQDAEYQYIVDTTESLNMQVAKAFRAAANAIGIRATKRSLGPQSEDNAARLSYYSAQADKLERAAAFGTVPPLPDYDSDKIFGKDMMANET